MSRRLASPVRAPLVAGLAVIALCGCGGHDKPAPAPPPVAVQAAAATPQPDPSPAATPSPSPTPGAVRVLDVAGTSPPITDATPPPAPSPEIPPPAPLPDPNAKPVEKPVDPLKWLQDSEARKADYQRRIAEAESEVADAGPPVALWERNVLAIKNPFLAPPKWSDEDKQTVAGMDGVERVKFAEGRLAEARAALEAAQKKLADLKANPPQ
jgi:hypothetical protein